MVMNKLTLHLRLIVFFVTLAACSTSDDNGGNNNDNSSNNFPLTINNYWNYNVENRNIITNDTQQRTDSLYVSSAHVNSYDLAVNGIANGTMNSILTQTSLTRTANSLLATGTVIFPFSGLEDLEIGIQDAIFYNTNAPEDNTLSEVSGTIEQIVENIPIVANYTFKTIQGPSYNTLFLNSENYNNVIKSSIELQLTITTTVEIIPDSFVDITILDTQNVLKIDNFYAENIGLVRSEADISYQLEDFSQVGIVLPFTTNLEATSLQELTRYDVAEE